ncbi:MAG: DUF1275 domain-containing protein [Spirochaetes bacterium]|uniref:DUF1275 domain-containing protein n=1 Tax=Candidatus Gallitreponema excrementavium TaxID=2840840 RepID=A0A9D9HQX4_9SPIR|nr:DUF1275 domain-containing protein [Candidatus Gallitreponema excrementavium]
MTGSNEVINPEIIFPECQKRHIFMLLMCAGGFMGAFTYILNGGVFCNAQTANFVLLAIALGQGHWKNALYYLLPISAYFGGTVLSEFFPERLKQQGSLRWDTVLVGIEIVIILGLGFLPETAPFQITQIAINFIASMQYNTFRQARNIPMATTFCTNHLRQTGIYIRKWVKTKNSETGKRILIHLAMIGIFVAGCIICTLLCPVFKGKAIWGAEIPLAIVFIDLLNADLKEGKSQTGNHK